MAEGGSDIEEIIAAKSVAPTLPSPIVVKEGWLLKRGDAVKTWKQRYFYLLNYGMLLGFKKEVGDLSNPLNSYNVKNCKIILQDKADSYLFTVRCLQFFSWSDRIFKVSSAKERRGWVDSILFVTSKLGRSPSMEDLHIATEEETKEALPQSCQKKKKEEEEEKKKEGGGAKASGSSGKQTTPKKKKKMTADDFEFLKLLGTGTFGKVILCRDKVNKKLYAMKSLRKDVVIEREQIECTLNENKILQKIRHPFIIHLKYSFTTTDRIFFVMEYACGGELYYHLCRDGKFSEDRALFYAAEICLALGHLHKKEILYRDLKLENLLLDSEGHIKITDFGFCKEIGPTLTTSSLCGTPEYLAPEILLGNDYGFSADWWCFGICLHEMLLGYPPFSDDDRDFLFHLILNRVPKYPYWLSPSAKQIIQELLVKDPSKRLGALGYEEVLNHRFFKSIDPKLLLKRKIAPPFVPSLTSDTDTSNFDSAFTDSPIALSVPGASQMDIIEKERQNTNEFEGFSYQGS